HNDLLSTRGITAEHNTLGLPPTHSAMSACWNSKLCAGLLALDCSRITSHSHLTRLGESCRQSTTWLVPCQKILLGALIFRNPVSVALHVRGAGCKVTSAGFPGLKATAVRANRLHGCRRLA